VLTPGQILSLRIDKPAAGGRMIARADGEVVLVSGVIPGEQAQVAIERVGRGVAYGRAVAIEEPSPDRQRPPGDPQCGGCLYAHVAYARQVDLKSQVIADALARIGRIAWGSHVEVAESPDLGYRMRARLHVRDRRIGFFREGTHDVCDARATRQLLPETCDALDRVSARFDVLGLTLGELEVSENVDASERVLHLESPSTVSVDSLAEMGAHPALTGMTVSRQAGEGLPPFSIVAGDPHVTDVVAVGEHRVVLRRHVLSFFQGNRFLLRRLVSHVVGEIPSGADVVELYAGVGLFSIAAAVSRGARVVAVEGDRMAADDLNANASGLGGVVRAVHQPVEAFLAHRRQPPGVVLVDPPRTGMSKASLQGVIALRPSTVIYVSCDVATLARDMRQMLDAGYEIQRVDGFDLFPNTPHVETVAVLTRILDGPHVQARRVDTSTPL
jgi:23S rRNA (uracil1939-C5)-methyltransferase